MVLSITLKVRSQIVRADMLAKGSSGESTLMPIPGNLLKASLIV